ncbi:histidine phosphatase family protein [Deinococcus sp. KNUC1210]|uniref:histidine phosphatase family protein n=1 Tax=Deinococcus sp. KNUC1210 TaxID=2917691 RepID=UPI001EEFDE7C|nr:histidine phosphatase family protein [Deinococcus sp. KNUC1210]ULH15318.1 histidine phosphatase family protein [Deinococcus sp. KNUC1210]
MSTLLLIRHGQATPFEADTDQLSELGERQAQAVGASLARAGVVPTRVLHGPMVRQRRSAELAAQPGWPAAERLPGLAEYDGDGQMRYLAPLLAQRDPAFATLLQEAEERRELPDRNRSFQKMLERLLDVYLSGELEHPQLESWAAFRGRVRAALKDILGSPGGSTVAVFTSGGVIGLMVASVLDAPDASALKLNWRVKNASITQLTFGSGRVSLDTFNETAHLGEALLSWR